MFEIDKSLLHKNPKVAQEWHSTKNGKLTPAEISYGSGKKVWWKCSKGHEWEDTILHRTQGRNCPYCSNHRVLMGYNNLFTTNPELELEWDFELNSDMDPNLITKGSHKKVWWKCSKGHRYESAIRERVKGKGCPYCSNKKVKVGFNDLATTHPDLAKEWDYEKNDKLLPTQVTSGSSKKVWWICENGHEWETAIVNRKNGRNCPYCINKKIIRGYNDLATVHPELIQEWDYKLNNGLLPSEVAPASSKKVWWRCKNGHRWQATILSRHQGYNCPICSNQQVLKGYNDLATTHSYLAEDWHKEKNGMLQPTDVVAGSAKKVWWLGKCGHEWQASLSSRSLGTGCPICANGTRISFPEKCVYFYLKKYFQDAEENVKLKELNKLELDIYIPSLRVGVEYDGSHWHTDQNKDILKDKLCDENNILLYRIRESNCPKNDKSTWIQLEGNCIDALERCIVRLLSIFRVDVEASEVNIERDRLKIYDAMNLSVREQSIENLFPEIAKQWHPSKNGKLCPNQFSSFSRKKVWWIGECGHEWDASIVSRTKGSGCPYCSNKRLLRGFNDLATTHPQLLEEWNYSKNTISPDSIFVGSEVLVWWKCENGHEWQEFPYKRKNGSGCPYCSNRRVLQGYNDLVTTHPQLVAEWNYERNINILSENFVAGSNKKVWWKCSKCGNEWIASITARSKGNGCKKCADRNLAETMHRRAVEKSGTLFEKYPELIEEWDYEKNKCINPKDITPNTNIKVWWKCKKCSHEWEASVNNRVKKHGCPVCSKKRITKLKRQTELNKRGSLLKNNPKLAAEWNYEKNDCGPNDVFQNSIKKVWWICPKGHEYQASPNNRNKGSNCPFCSNRKILIGYNDFASLHSELLEDWDYHKNHEIDPSNISSGSDKKVWWKCKICGYEWCAKIGNRVKGNGCPKCARRKTKAK